MSNIAGRIPLPRRLPARVWLISIPSALVSFEKRQGVPKLPLGRARFIGALFVAGAVACWVSSSRMQTMQAEQRCPAMCGKPRTMAGIMALSGIALLLRSTVLAVYSLALAFVDRKAIIEVEEPEPELFLDGKGPRILNEVLRKFADSRRSSSRR